MENTKDNKEKVIANHFTTNDNPKPASNSQGLSDSEFDDESEYEEIESKGLEEHDIEVIEQKIAQTSSEPLKHMLSPYELKSLHFDDMPFVKDPADKYLGRPRAKMNGVSKEPSDIFFQLFPMKLIKSIVDYSNMYKNKKQSSCPDISIDEMIKYIGLMMAHSVCTPFNAGSFGKHLPKSRWDEISQFLHFCDPYKQNSTGNDEFSKIRILHDTLNETFQSSFVPGSHMSFDEGTWATGKENHQSKRNKFAKSLKIFMLCCSETGFCSRFELHKTKSYKDEQQAGPMALRRIAQHFKNSKRTIYCDHFYTTIGLFIELLSMGIYAVGSVNTNVSGFPKELTLDPKTTERGTSICRTTKIPLLGNVQALSWMDKKPEYMISTSFVGNPISIERQCGNRNELVSTLLPYVKYESYMANDNLKDALQRFMYRIQSRLKFKKWYQRCFAAALDLVATNCYIIYKMIHGLSSTDISHAEFLEKLSTELVTARDDGTKITVSSKENEPHKYFLYSHNHPECIIHPKSEFAAGEGYNGGSRNQRNCFVPGCKRTTKYYCKECGNIAACISTNDEFGVPCYIKIHTDPVLVAKIKRKKLKQSRKSEAQLKEEETKETQKKAKRLERINKNPEQVEIVKSSEQQIPHQPVPPPQVPPHQHIPYNYF